MNRKSETWRAGLGTILCLVVVLLVVSLPVLASFVVAPEPEPAAVCRFEVPSTVSSLEYVADVEEGAVYSAWLNAHVGTDTNSTVTRPIVIRDLTGTWVSRDVSEERVEWLSTEFPTLSHRTLEDFRIKNREPHLLSSLVQFNPPYNLLSETERHQIFQGGPIGWSEFRKRDPASWGISSLSRVGFNRTSDQAFLCVYTVFGWDSFREHCVLFGKENGLWKIQQDKIVLGTF